MSHFAATDRPGRLFHEWPNGRERYRAVGGRLAVRATNEAGRWRLALEVWSDGGWRGVLESALDPPDASDLALTGPAFQDCHARVRDAEVVELLLVGQHGRRHFSGAISVATDTARFDFADRWTVPLDLATVVYRWEPLKGASIAKTPWQLRDLVTRFQGPRVDLNFSPAARRDVDGGLAIEILPPFDRAPPGTLSASWWIECPASEAARRSVIATD